MAAMKSSKYSPEDQQAYPSDYLYAKENYKEKTAQANLVSALVAPQLFTHFVSGYADEADNEARMHGEQPSMNPVTHLIKKYPGMIGLGLSAAGLRYGVF